MSLFGRIQRKVIRQALPAIFRPSNTEELTRLGSRYGGWTIPLARLNKDSVCYSFGVGEDVTFDLALASKVGCRVHLFDPTPRSRTHFKMLEEAAQRIPQAWTLLEPVYNGYYLTDLHLLSLHEIGVWSEDCILDFYEPANPKHVSHSATNIQQTNVGFRAAVRSVLSIARMLGHERIDLLKMDIEGAEMTVIDSLLSNGPLPECMCVEFDAAAQGGLREITLLRELTNRLKSAGYRLAHIEDWNFLFMRG